MVNLSHEAAELIEILVAESDLSESAGLRLGTDDDSHALSMNLEASPREDDVVLRREGAAVWISPVAAARLQDQTLQAQLAPRPAFFLD